MGVRERNATRTRELILDAALGRFGERGYDATTMEEVAEGADVGTSTLYRYFPTKDALVLTPLALHGQMAAELLARPAEEPLDLALGHALRAFVTAPRVDPPRLRQILAVVEANQGLQARLTTEFVKERTLLEQAISQRLGRPVDDIFCVMTARITTTLLELFAEPRADRTDDPAVAEEQFLAAAERILAKLRSEPPVLPRIER